MQGTIELTLMNCIWIKSVEIVEKLTSINEEVLMLDIKKQIVQKNLGAVEKKSLERLREMAQKTGMSLVKLFTVFPCCFSF